MLMKLRPWIACVAFLLVQDALASNFSLSPYGTLPTTALPGQTVAAYVYLTNLTSSARQGYSVVGLPANVVQNTATGYCGASIDLAAGERCLLALDIQGPAAFNLALCRGNNCTGSGFKINVSLPTQPRFAYITSFDSTEQVMVCAVNPDSGRLQGCRPTSGWPDGFTPVGIALSPEGPTAYLSGYYASDIVQCSINTSTGSFERCSSSLITTPPSYNNYYGFLALTSNNTALFTNSDFDLFSCPIINTITQGSCQNTGAVLGSNQPNGFVLNATNSVAYVANDSPAVVTTCAVNFSNGSYLFSACGQKSGGSSYTFSEPISVALNGLGSIVYITDQGDNKVYGCQVSGLETTSAEFQSCFVAYSPIATPSGMVINATNTMAYITGASGVFSCAIQADRFVDCWPMALPNTVDIALLY